MLHDVDMETATVIIRAMSALLFQFLFIVFFFLQRVAVGLWLCSGVLRSLGCAADALSYQLLVSC